MPGAGGCPSKCGKTGSMCAQLGADAVQIKVCVTEIMVQPSVQPLILQERQRLLVQVNQARP